MFFRPGKIYAALTKPTRRWGSLLCRREADFSPGKSADGRARRVRVAPRSLDEVKLLPAGSAYSLLLGGYGTTVLAADQMYVFPSELGGIVQAWPLAPT